MIKGLDYDDVLIIPKYSDAESRTEPNVSSYLCKDVKIECPIIPANMDCIATKNMRDVMWRINGNKAGNFIHHRFVDSTDIFTGVNGEFVTVGLRDFPNDIWKERVKALDAYGCNFVIDIAHAHSKFVFEALSYIKTNTNKKVIVGNIATSDAARDFCMAGADGLKCGIGGGYSCLTRKVTGIGVPNLTAIMWVSKVAKQFRVPVIADGGIKSSSDVAKALAAGADSVMIGALLAGSDEAGGVPVALLDRWYQGQRIPGEEHWMELSTYASGKDFWNEYVKFTSGKITLYDFHMGQMVRSDVPSFNIARRYWGQSSEDYQNEWYGQVKEGTIPEGETMHVRITGPAKDTIDKLIQGLKSSMTYAGALSIKEFQRKAEFIEVNRQK